MRPLPFWAALACALLTCAGAAGKSPRHYKIKYPATDGPVLTRDQVEKRLVERGDSMFFYRGEPFTGILLDTANNTGWPIMGWYRDGDANGPFLGFFDEQRTHIRFAAYQKNGKREGEYFHWHENGTLSFHCRLHEGKLTGKRYCYHRDGTLWHIHHYKNDKEHGIYTEWYGPWQKESECRYRDGKRDGYYRGWSRSGRLKIEGRHVQDVRQGEWTQYNEDGTVRVSSIYKDGAAVMKGKKHPDPQKPARK
ncbi:MAG: hypothetical protein LBU95_00275 [Rikenellaceae bacterium]|jgi:antitoxin component YwqK of YwqJK toxin-antitoxin module|nr:hypothetical protein [Rikenellaceae bacterium]